MGSSRAKQGGRDGDGPFGMDWWVFAVILTLFLGSSGWSLFWIWWRSRNPEKEKEEDDGWADLLAEMEQKKERFKSAQSGGGARADAAAATAAAAAAAEFAGGAPAAPASTTTTDENPGGDLPPPGMDHIVVGVPLSEPAVVGVPLSEPAPLGMAAPRPSLVDLCTNVAHLIELGDTDRLFEQYERLFELADTDCNGVLDSDEVQRLLAGSGFLLDDRTVGTILDRADTNRNRVIEYTEFCRAVRALHNEGFPIVQVDEGKIPSWFGGQSDRPPAAQQTELLRGQRLAPRIRGFGSQASHWSGSHTGLNPLAT